MAVTAVSRVAFRRKRNPETYPCTLFFSLSLLTVVTVVTIMASTDRREHTQPFEKLKRYLAPTPNIQLFFVAVSYCFLVVTPCILCTFAQWLVQLRQGIRALGIYNIPIYTLGIFGILAFSESAKMQCVQGGNC